MRKGADRKFEISAAELRNGPLLAHRRVQAARSSKGARPLLTQKRAAERVRILLAIVRAIDVHAAAGRPVAAQCQKFAARWKGRVYRCDPSRWVALSAETLRRVYYGRWLRSGRQVEALQFRYGANVPKFTLTLSQRRKIRTALRTCTSWAQLYATIFPRRSGRPSDRIFRRAFDAPERQTISSVFAARRQSRALERRFAQWLYEPCRTFTPNRGGRA